MRLVTLMGIALATALAACGAGEGPYVQQNERILAALPEIPGAVRLTVESSPYYEEEAGHGPIGYTTNVTYEAPAGMTAEEVVDYYVRNLGNEWEYRLEEVPMMDGGTGIQMGSILLAHFTRGTAMVSLNTDGMIAGGLHTFEIAVDYRGVR
jgi:hypothetical protein